MKTLGLNRIALAVKCLELAWITPITALGKLFKYSKLNLKGTHYLLNPFINIF